MVDHGNVVFQKIAVNHARKKWVVSTTTCVFVLGKLMRAESPRPLQSWYILNVQVKRSARADKRFLENLATEAEAAAKHQEQGSQGKFVEFSGEQRHLFVTIKVCY